MMKVKIILLFCSIATSVTTFLKLSQLLQELSRSAQTEEGETIIPNVPSSKLARSVDEAPLGSLGPKQTSRENLRYYDTLFYTTLQFGKDASSIIEIGCSSDPFIQHIGWIDNKTCLAPYFVEYENETGENNNTSIISTMGEIDKITADFMNYDIQDYSYDLLVCSQVLEHVPDPAAFTKKLIESAKISIISVPFMWGECGEICNHVTHYISHETILDWAEPHYPIYRTIITEENGVRRLIAVFKPDEF